MKMMSEKFLLGFFINSLPLIIKIHSQKLNRIPLKLHEEKKIKGVTTVWQSDNCMTRLGIPKLV